jgi:hypothetical protein
MDKEAPFVWDAGADVSLACALQDCFDHVASLCPDASPCQGQSQTITSNAIVMEECLADGTRLEITEYASSADERIVRPDGTECLRINGSQYQDPAGQTLAEFDTQGSEIVLKCGGLASGDAGLCNDHRMGKKSLLSLGNVGLCPPGGTCSP